MVRRFGGLDMDETANFMKASLAKVLQRKTSMVHDLTILAMILGATLTRAHPSTELYGCWAARIELAAAHFDRGDEAGAREWVAEANSYAI
jgi:hypothetical protein